ncbi:D-alanyl-D-alanine carboxypeptidase [Maribacter sp. 2307ULW6-5]|uniref:D-alanyl-D-alanine carboxypeptidase n=1 Tax=Maribacter sp. 2307ULW6-5 TaxID=3386275 RepID=UPI0039BC56C1
MGKGVSVLLLLLAIGCATPKKKIVKVVEKGLNGAFYDHQFTGVLIVDALSKDTLYSKNSKKYFTPASNTKIFTLYTALKALPQHIPALKYLERKDTLYFEGTGDPSFLHTALKDSTALHFLKQKEHLVWVTGNFKDGRFGPGWSWEDYDVRYAPERSALPLYGNLATLFNVDGSPRAIPTYFRDSIVPEMADVNRLEDRNLFYYDAGRTDTLQVPFKATNKTVHGMLQLALDKPVKLSKEMPPGPKSTLYGSPADSLYTLLMQDSDNFIAEQLLLLAASVWTDTLQSGLARTRVLDGPLGDLPQMPRWVDGSGLSRYNLFTPQSMVHVLDKLLKEVPRERLFRIFPAGGVSGTLKDGYASKDGPYIFAKSGSLGNNYCLSGYLMTRSGKTLLFSFMNNHYRKPTAQVKERMQRFFEHIRDTY